MHHYFWNMKVVPVFLPSDRLAQLQKAQKRWNFDIPLSAEITSCHPSAARDVIYNPPIRCNAQKPNLSFNYWVGLQKLSSLHHSILPNFWEGCIDLICQSVQNLCWWGWSVFLHQINVKIQCSLSWQLPQFQVPLQSLNWRYLTQKWIQWVWSIEVYIF